MLGEIEGKRRRRRQDEMLDAVTHSQDMNVGKLQETAGIGGPGVPQSTGPQRAGHDLATEHS